MATEVERLVVSLEASITKYERSMQRALGQTNTQARKIEQRFEKMSGTVNNAFGKIAAVYASAQALRGATALIDANTRMENSLKVAGLEGEALTRVYDALYASAQRNAAPLESLVTLYGRAAVVQKELGVSTEELLSFTDNVALALRVAGTDAQTASGSLLQLSQALGAGTVRAEEFNSILEGALPVAQAAAAGLEEAGGSVAKLRALVVDGKVSSEAFFRAFEVGAATLREKVAGSELTVSQAFIRLQNVLINVAGQFNESTNTGAQFANFLEMLGDRVQIAGDNFEKGITPVQRFLDLVMTASREAGKAVGADNIGKAIKEGLEGSHSTIERTEVLLTEAEQALVNLSNNTDFGPIEAAFEDLIQQILEGKGTAELAEAAIVELGKVNPEFASLQSKISEAVSGFFALRDAAVAARSAAQFNDVGAFPSSEQFNTTLGITPPPKAAPVSLADYPVSGGSGAGGKGGGKSPVDKYNEALAAQEKRTAALQRETALQAQLNPLVNDYGFAMERLRAQMELENAAKEAGLPLDEKRQEQIEGLATGYANATAEAGRLAEAQNRAKESADALAQAGRQALDTIVDGFLEGKDAGEVLQSVVKDLTRSLITMGLNAIGGGLFGGGGLGGIFGGLFGGRGFASGTANTGGARGQPRGVVHGQEAVIPLPSGGRVPVDIRMPTMPAAGPSGPVQIILEVQEGSAFTTRILQVSGPASAEIASRTVKGYDTDLGSRSAEKQARFG